MFRSPIHLNLPGTGPRAVYAQLSIAAGPGDDFVVGYTVRDLLSHEPIALGCGPSVTRQDLPDQIEEVLHALLGAVDTLLELGPFDQPS